MYKNNLNNYTNIKLKIACLVRHYLNVEMDPCNYRNYLIDHHKIAIDTFL